MPGSYQGAITAGVPKQRLEFTYDSENRRVRKVRKGWVSNAWVVQADLRFLYDGWNLVAELEPVVVTSATSLPAYVRTYTWGKDVTGTEQGAGGVGGLLFVGRYTKDTGTNVLASTLAPMYDGNSNIEGYVKLLVPTASTSAAATTAFKLEYDPFGRELMIEATSPETQATLPPFRFSTKYTDSETDLVYYGERYYSPELGRWISRDPIEEAGGLNLYGMVGNDPVNYFDVLGMKKNCKILAAGFGFDGAGCATWPPLFRAGIIPDAAGTPGTYRAYIPWLLKKLGAPSSLTLDAATKQLASSMVSMLGYSDNDRAYSLNTKYELKLCADAEGECPQSCPNGSKSHTLELHWKVLASDHSFYQTLVRTNGRWTTGAIVLPAAQVGFVQTPICFNGNL